MRKYKHYKQIYDDYISLCAEGRQNCSFSCFCQERGVEFHNVRTSLLGRGWGLKGLPGYRRISKKAEKGADQQCLMAYNEFKRLCAEGRQPGSFIDYYRGFGISRDQMHGFQKKNKLRVVGLPGFNIHTALLASHAGGMPFEDVIFEESGFMPACESVITVKVDGRIAVSFPADTDVSVIARFVRKLGKEAEHVGA